MSMSLSSKTRTDGYEHPMRFGRGLIQRILLLATVVLLATPGVAKPPGPESRDFVGRSDMKDGRAHVTWHAWFDVSAERVIERLTMWEHAKVFQERAVGFELIKRKKDEAVFVIEQETPVFFMPNIKITFGASVKRQNGTSTVTWVQREGPAKSAIRTWRVTSRAGGAWVEHETRVVLPFTPPAFLRGGQWQSVVKQVAVARREFGATLSRGRSPKAEVLVSPSSAPLPERVGAPRKKVPTKER